MFGGVVTNCEVYPSLLGLLVYAADLICWTDRAQNTVHQHHSINDITHVHPYYTHGRV